jgi:hypothetical protein
VGRDSAQRCPRTPRRGITTLDSFPDKA